MTSNKLLEAMVIRPLGQGFRGIALTKPNYFPKELEFGFVL